VKTVSSPKLDHNSRWRSSRSRAAWRPIANADLNSRGPSSAPSAVVRTGGLDTESVLLYELESLEWRFGQLEAALSRFVRMATKITRLYRRLGRMLLRTPLAGICHKLMGHTAPAEQYRRWFMQHRATDPYRNPAAAEDIVKPLAPLISIVIPIYQPQPAWLKTVVDSVRAQTYRNWQLLLVLDGDPGGQVLTHLRRFASEDPRIQCISSAHGGISASLNQGLNACSGTYTAFIDQDDILEETALSHVAAAILRDGPDILYTDEDYVDEHGNASLPLFKPAWSPALLLSCMYFGHLLVVDTERAKAIGGFRSAYDGAQNYDFVLRLTDHDANVVHIPRVLYHWRQRPGSTSMTRDAKPYSRLAGLKALREALARRQLKAIVQDGSAPNTYRLSHPFSTEDSVALIIPTRNPKLLSRLLASLQSAQDGLRRDVHVILHCQENQDDEKIVAICRRFGAHVFEYHGPFNFSLMNNLAAAGISNRYLVFMNDDILVRSGHWLEQLCTPFLRPQVGIVGAELRYPDGTIQHSGVVTGVGDGAGHSGRFEMGSPFWPWLDVTRNVSAVTGACLAVRRALFDRLGGFDTRFFNNYNDVDLCLRAQTAGFEVVLSCESSLCHDEGSTRQTGTNLRERFAFWTQWGSVLGQADYFYSPNLARRLETIDLSTPSSYKPE
jgi:GT2 family glycosyltransferase